MDDDRAAGQLTGKVALCPEDGPDIQPVVGDAVVSRQQIVHRLRTVVDDDQLLRRVVLPQEVANRLGDEGAPVEGGHDAANQRCSARRQSGSRAGRVERPHAGWQVRLWHRFPACGPSRQAACDSPAVAAVADVDEDALRLDRIEPRTLPHGLVEEGGVFGE